MAGSVGHRHAPAIIGGVWEIGSNWQKLPKEQPAAQASVEFAPEFQVNLEQILPAQLAGPVHAAPMVGAPPGVA